ncbi:energy transducer TonB [Telluria mixta]|uniref:Energy transducer TonB n=1 Tax=Telluria mixta TaxID=34071 RepID=A0ABT2BRU3_9BURK|nr:energy transducer TonB [Telluria mixta]MCS0627836.1 energy transducer TonB [Telluria mixta]WEM94044.1 energy transducer TonB [Telluria mixta]
MSRIIRTTLQCLSLALACAASAHAAPQTTRPPMLDFASCAKPQYPHADVQAAHEGTVKLGFLVDENGKVKDSKVMASSGFTTLDEAARSALAQCSFRPALKNGKAVREWAKVQYVWTLR